MQIKASRTTIVDLFARAKAAGFSIGRLRCTQMSIQIPGESGDVKWMRGADPVVVLHKLEAEGLNHRMSPAEVAASICVLKVSNKIMGSSAYLGLRVGSQF